MKPSVFIGALLATLGLVVSCDHPFSGSPVRVDQSLTVNSATSPHDGSVFWGFSPGTDTGSIRSVSLHVDAPASSHVTYLYTNISSSTSSRPVLSADLQRATAEASPPLVAEAAGSVRLEMPQRLPENFLSGAAFGRSLGAPSPTVGAPATESVGTAISFKDHDFNYPYALILTPSHLVAIKTVGSRTVKFWVSDDSYSGTALSGYPKTAVSPNVAPAHTVDDTMIANLGNAFLATGGSDIYHWVSTVFGTEWYEAGDTIAGGLIDGKQEINIFIKNLNPHGTTGGTLMGYFDSTNNFSHSYASWSADSNERILFALDADSVATDMPEALSTLAHEFQHMIQFYQKSIRNNLGLYTDTWINEMASLAAEDLVADKLGVDGPRGVASTDYTVGSAANGNGRLPLFDATHDWTSLTGWGDGYRKNVLDSYSMAYAFGAWLMRNYGGPTLLHDLVTNPYTDVQAVVHAVNTHASTIGNPQTYTTLVRDWGLATFLGSSSVRSGLMYAHRTSPPATDAFSFTYGLSYNLGSINLKNYQFLYTDATGTHSYNGPWVRSSTPTTPVYAGSTTMVPGPALSASGTLNATLTLPPNVVLTVVVTP